MTLILPAIDLLMPAVGERRSFAQPPSNSMEQIPPADDSNAASRVASPPSSSPDRLLPVPTIMTKQDVTGELSMSDSRYSYLSFDSRSPVRGIDSKFSLSPDIGTWGTEELDDYDDELHQPDDLDHKGTQYGGRSIPWRGLINLGCLIFVCVGIVTLFAGYPIIAYFTSPKFPLDGRNNVNATGQIPGISSLPSN